MAYTITLSDEDYAALAAAAARSGFTIEELAHQAIVTRFPASHPPQQIGKYQYPSGEPITDEEEDAMERLAQEIGSEHPWASEIVIEDRGPR